MLSNWKQLSKTALERDKRICQVCGKENSGQVHHILPRSQGGKDELSNLMILCGRCHMVISPIPKWLITKVWKIPKEQIETEKQKVLAKIDEIQKRKT